MTSIKKCISLGRLRKPNFKAYSYQSPEPKKIKGSNSEYDPISIKLEGIW